MTAEQTARRLVRLLEPGIEMTGSRVSGDAVLVSTATSTYRVSLADVGSLEAKGWQVYDVALEVMAEPPVFSEGIAVNERGDTFRLHDNHDFSAFSLLVHDDVDAAELARLAAWYLLAAPSTHVLTDLEQLDRAVSSAVARGIDGARAPDLSFQNGVLTLRFCGWRLNREAAVDVDSWTVRAAPGETRTIQDPLATGLRWAGNDR